MFLGHIGVGLVCKRAAPKASLGVLMTAAMALDLLWPLFLVLGIERVRIAPGNTAFTPLDFASYPWTHSLLMALVWASLFYLATTRAKRWTGHLALWSFVGLLVLAYVGSVIGPPPPRVRALRGIGLITWVFVPWAFWIERTRELRAAAA